MNKPIEDIDIFQRTLKCQDIPLPEPEIEIYDSEASEKVEEEEIVEEPESEIDYVAIYNELECLKRQIQKLLLLLKSKGEPLPEPETTCAEEKAICELQKAHHKIQCQIYELIRCYQVIKEEIRQMHSFFCKQIKDVEQLWRITAFLKYWQIAMKPDEGVCHQRFVYLNNKKSEWIDIKALIEEKRHCPDKLMKRYLNQENFHKNRISLQVQLERLKKIFVNIFEMKNPNFSDYYGAIGLKFMPLKQIEFDYIMRQIRKNSKEYDKSCKEVFKCDKIDWK